MVKARTLRSVRLAPAPSKTPREKNFPKPINYKMSIDSCQSFKLDKEDLHQILVVNYKPQDLSKAFRTVSAFLDQASHRGNPASYYPTGNFSYVETKDHRYALEQSYDPAQGPTIIIHIHSDSEFLDEIVNRIFSTKEQ